MEDDVRGANIGAGMKGWLSELLFPTVLGGTGAIAPLSKRLGGRSTIDLPIQGRTSGMPDVNKALEALQAWLTERQAAYALTRVIIGTDRDVSEGSLTLSPPGLATVTVPVAVVAERRRSREVELRVYHAITGGTGLGGEPRPAREATVRDQPQEARSPSAPVLAQSHIGALRRGDGTAILACFEAEGVLVDKTGARHGKADGGILAYYAAEAGVGEEGGGMELVPHGYADDGRACAIELTRTRIRGADVPPTSLLAVYERGDSGLFKELRLYED